MRKTGFTLIEIIVSIAIISVIGVTFTFGTVHYNKVAKEKQLDNLHSEFDNALKVYLASNNDALVNVNRYTEGAVITLETLKNAGLIDDNIVDPTNNKTLDYKNNYYVVANAVLLENELSDEDILKECDNKGVSIDTFSSWDLKEIDTSKTIYICPKNYNDLSKQIADLQTDVNSLKDRVKTLEENATFVPLLENGYIAKGENPKNWVVFEVKSDTTKPTSFPSDSEQNLWRIFSYIEGELKLVYNKTIGIDPDYDYEPKYSIEHHRVDGTGWFSSEIEGATPLKQNLVDSLIHKNYVKKTNYYYEYNWQSRVYNLNLDKPISDYMGVLSINDYNQIKGSGDWLPKPFIIGYSLVGLGGSRQWNLNLTTNGGINNTTGGWPYLPVVTLKDKVKIVKNDSCAKGTTLGTKECPYKLSCDDC